MCLQLRLIPNFAKGCHGCLLLCFPHTPHPVMSLERVLGFPGGHTPVSRWLWHPLKCSGYNLESTGSAEVRQGRRTRISGSRNSRARSWEAVQRGRPAQGPAWDNGSTSKRPPGPGPRACPSDPISKGGPARGDAAPVDVGRGRSPTGSAAAGCGAARSPSPGAAPA